MSSKPDFYHYRECTKSSTDPACKQQQEHFAFLDLPSDAASKKWYIAILMLAIITLLFGCYCACRKD
jgi:hypothetical protein